MAYQKPSVLVYEQIVNSGGVAANIPSLTGCIIGPAYNVVQYVAGSPTASVASLAGSLTDNAVTNNYPVPSSKPGQVVDLSSFEVWASLATCQTYASSATVATGSNVVTYITGQTSFTALMPSGGLQIQPGFAVQATSSTGVVFHTTVLSVTNAASGTFTTADIFPFSGTAALVITSKFNDILLSPTTYSTTNVGVSGVFSVLPLPATPYGTLVSGNIYAQYNALRTDIANQLLTFNGVLDVEGTLGVINSTNRLALGVQIALGAAGGAPIYGMAVASDDTVGYSAALTAIENQNVYCLAPLTQQEAVLTLFQTHVDDMSTPQYAAWRAVVCNTLMATAQDIGIYGPSYLNTGASLSVNTAGPGYILTATNATFVADGVDPGDVVVASGGSVGNYIVQGVVSNQQLIVTGPTAAATGVSYYITRTLTAQQMANNVASTSSTFNDSRVWHVQPDLVGVSVGGQTQYLPGYYLAAMVAGQVAGSPVQQGFTNSTAPGIVDLLHSSFFFSRSQLDTMAGAGTCLFVQDIQGGIPYCRHSLTTNMASVVNQEILMVKNTDALAYYFYGILKPFIGKWNVVQDTLNTIYQSLTGGATQLEGQVLPQIGPPLLSHKIASLVQDPVNQDSIDITLVAGIVFPNNYVNLYLQV